MKLPRLKITFLLKIVTSLFLISLFAPENAFGFEDYFDGETLDSNKWERYYNGGQIDVSNGFLHLSSYSSVFPYVHTKQNPFLETGDFQIKIKMQYTSLTTRGGGIVIGNFIPPNSCSVSYHDSHGKEIILFAMLQDSSKHLRVVFVPCRSIDECEDEHSIILQLEEDNTELNEFQIIYSESRYKFIFNGTLIFTSNETPRRPTTLYIGNPTYHGHAYPWSSFRVDSIEIFPPFPTPTPSLNPIILLPGLGASWNYGEMIAGRDVEQEDWHMTPFVKVYDGLIQTLKNVGYEDTGDDQNLFVFNYDWRQPIETTAHQLGEYVENTVDPPGGTEIDLIGHSLGGMVARTYVQNNSSAPIDQLITIGSPHKGAPKVYYLWEGANLKKTLSTWQRIGAGILLHLNKKDFQNNVKAIRDIIPCLKDLLPTFPYLKQGGVEKPLSGMDQRNDWLGALNQLPLPDFLTLVLNSIAGVKENSTLRWINVEDQNQLDRFLGKWKDGKPIEEEFDSGDGTVLLESAQLEGINEVIKLPGLDHRELVETVAGQQAIVDLLGLSPSSIIPAPETTYEPSLILQIASPANLTVIDPDSIEIADREKLVFISNPKEEGDYNVWVNSENSGGPYRLLVGKITESGDSWIEYSGEVSDSSEEIDDITFISNPQQIKQELLELAKDKLSDAKNSAQKLPRPFKKILIKAIERIIKQVDEIIALLEKNLEDRLQTKARQAIFSLSILEKNLRLWSRFLGSQPGIEDALWAAKGYLLQVYEFE